jgi:hypothetical protein
MFFTNYSAPDQTVMLKYTLNSSENPGPWNIKSCGEFFNPAEKVKLTREFLQDKRYATFKVIAVVPGKMPSEVAQKTYTIKEHLQPVPIEKEDYVKKADQLHHDTGVNLGVLNF